MKSVGIDIGSASIKVVELTAHAKGVRLTSALEHQIGKTPGFDTQIEIVDYLKNLAASYEPGTKFVVGLRQEKVSLRHKTFPFADRLKILKSLPFELEEDLPFTSESAIFDAKVIRYQGAQTELIACAAPKAKIQELLSFLKDTRIDPTILSVEGIALANCFEQWMDAPPSIAPSAAQFGSPQLPNRSINCVIHIGHTRTLVLAFEQNKLIGVRTVFWGAKNIIEAIVKKYEIPFVEAFKEFTTKAFVLATKEGASYDQIVFSDTIAKQFNEVAKDLKISLMEFNSEFNAEVTSIEVSGGGSQILNLNALLTQLLELPVNPIRAFQPAGIAGVDSSLPIAQRIPVALGLAIEGLKKPRNPALNFLKGEFAQQNVAFTKLWSEWGLAIKTMTAGFFIFLGYAFMREDFSLKLADKASEVVKTQARTIAKLPAKNANESGVRKYIRDQKRKINNAEKIAGVLQMNSALDIFKKISEAVPTKNAIKLNVESLNIADDMVTIEGFVENTNQLQQLRSALMNISANGQVNMVTPKQKSTQGLVDFGYQFKVNRGF